jgi:hypothetical protein
MESYIVRVYRRGRHDPDEVAGIVETVGTESRLPFKSFSELVTAIRCAINEDYAGEGIETKTSQLLRKL